MHPQVSKARARVAVLTRCVNNGDRQPEELVSAKRDLAEANIAAYVDKVLSKAPPLTPDQRTRLAELLRPVRVAAGDAA